MPEPIIKIENIGKKYTIQHQQKYLALRDVISDVFTRKNPKITSEAFWALRDISFTVNKGDVVGIIGKNGSGKSTLLKILSRITPPTEGRILMKGRASCLLEVGTGFNPELTGRENIYLNGAILGMSQKEIRKKFDEIVDFSGIDKFLDTPVKHYSSGMYVRLAFSIAAYLEPEILIVDEVLAVGDMEFQKKCMGKMGDVAKSGRTIFFVSHNMSAIEQLCNRCLLIDSGRQVYYSYNVKEVTNKYILTLYKNVGSSWENTKNIYSNPYFVPIKMYVVDENGTKVTGVLDRNKNYSLVITAEIFKTIPGLMIGYAIYSENGSCLYWSYNTDSGDSIDRLSNVKGKVLLSSRLPTEFLNNGEYTIDISAAIFSKEWLLKPQQEAPRIKIEVTGNLSNSIYYTDKRPTILSSIVKWEMEEINESL